MNANTRLNVYKGKHIESLAIDDDQSILYIADSKTKRIDSLQYGAKILAKSNSSSGLAETLYETVNNLASVTSLAIDYQGNIYWSVGDEGTSDGAIFRGRADDPNPTKVDVISKTLDAIYSLCFRKGFLFYAGEDMSKKGDEDDVPTIIDGPVNDDGEVVATKLAEINEPTRTALYYKHIPKPDETSSSVSMISGGFSDIVSIGSMTGFLYVADADKGFFAVETFPDDMFSEPRPLELTTSSSTTAPMPKAMVVFTMGGILNVTLSMVALLAATSITFF